MRCPRCGWTNPNGVSVCSKCGRELHSIPDHKPSKTGWLMGMIACAAAISALLPVVVIGDIIVGVMSGIIESDGGAGFEALLSTFAGAGFGGACSLLFAFLLDVVSIALLVVAGIKLRAGDVDLSARILFADYVLLSIALMAVALLVGSGNSGGLWAVGANIIGAFIWVPLIACICVIALLGYRLFVRR